ncbi:hypothetical protein QJQ45_010232 [Haematococcus lacustris]|nr:hypothetical protein QJQ45_010232 [Haematococcus lacustris]
MNKAHDAAMKLQAQLEQLHQQLSDAVANLHQVQAGKEQLKAAQQELQALATTMGGNRLSKRLSWLDSSEDMSLHTHRSTLNNIDVQDFTLQLPELRAAVRLHEVAAAVARAPPTATRKAIAAACSVGGVVVNVGDHASQQRVAAAAAAAAAAGCSRVVPPGKAAKGKPAPQVAIQGMQCSDMESRWRPLELCWWPEQGALPAKGKEYPGLGYKRLRDKPPKAQPAVAQ